MSETRTEKFRKAISGMDVLISFLLIISLFAALLLTCFIPIYFYFSSYVTNDTISAYQEKLDAGTARLDNTFSTLSNTVKATVEDSNFRVFRYINSSSLDPVSLPEMRDTLYNLLFSDELVGEAGLLLPSDVVITRSRTFHGSQYYSLYPDFLSCKDMTEAEWRAAMDASRPLMAEKSYTTANTDLAFSDSYDALTWSSYWTNGNYRTKSVFYALLPSEKLLAVLTDADVIERGRIEICDSNGNVLLSRSGGEADDVSTVSTTTRNHSLRITVGVPNSIIHEQMQGFRHIIWLYAAGMIVFALALTLLFASRLSQPLRRLRMLILGSRYLSAEYARNDVSDAHFLKSYNRQFDQLAQSIDDVEKQMEAYEAKISVQRASMRSQMLDKALHRGLQNAEDFRVLFTEFPHRYRLCVLRYELCEDTAIEFASQLQANITAAVRGLLGDITIHPIDGSALALIIPYSDNADEITPIQHLRSYLTEITDQPISCTISDVFTEPEQLIDAYQQTQFLHSAFADSGMFTIEQMKDLPPQKQLLPLSYTKLNSIYTAIYAGNLPALLFTLDECTQELENADASLLQHIYNQLVELIAHVRLENPVLLYEIAVPAFDRGVRLPKDFGPYFEAICEKLYIEREDQSLMFSKQIIDYINENLCDPDMYLSSVLSHFEISAPTLQKMVRLATNQTFASYVEEQRLVRAHDLLAQSSLSIQEIAMQCGFASTNTFYKSFRRKYGMGPQDMRKN